MQPIPYDDLKSWRRRLHRRPEISGSEQWTAAQVAAKLQTLEPDRLETGVGGHGVLARFGSDDAKRRVLLRCELDGLPIQEINTCAHASEVAGAGHLCGHDGHMAILMAVAHRLSERPFANLDVGLLFQPAEETGVGAKAVIGDARFAEFAPDIALSLHNYPSIPLGQVRVKAGPFACASRGMRIKLTGKTAHASQPENGRSPARAMADIMGLVAGWNAPAPVEGISAAMATLTHARLGEATFGVAPGQAEIWVTLRTPEDPQMSELCARAERESRQIAEQYGLDHASDYHDIFHACINDAGLAEIVQRAAKEAGVEFAPLKTQVKWSEDFGRFAKGSKAAMFLIGSGEDCPALHNPDYDFPDQIIEPAANIFLASLRLISREAQ